MRWPPSTGETNTGCSALSSEMVRVPNPELIEALDRLNAWFGSDLRVADELKKRGGGESDPLRDWAMAHGQNRDQRGEPRAGVRA